LKRTLHFQAEVATLFVKDGPLLGPAQGTKVGQRIIKEVPLGDDKWDGNFF
jgi:hypothetical protein